MKVPFADLRVQYLGMKAELDTAIQNVIDETAFVRGKYVNEFEKTFRLALGADHCVSCANGTDAIYIALRALGVGPGDEVVTPALSWIATSETITQTGAQVVFADIDEHFTIDPESIAEKITDRTKAIIVVHLYGQSADMDPIMDIAKRNNLFVIEDCAQAHFAKYRGRNVGTLGTVATFSFYPGKNLGAYGDAGAITSNDAGLIERARMFANHGSLTKHEHEIEGVNSRMDGLQAAILLAKMKHIDSWNAARMAHGLAYNERLRDVSAIKIPEIRDNSDHVFHLYVVRLDERDKLKSSLAEAGIATGIHYPVALPFLRAYKHLGHVRNDFPVAHGCQASILSLPMFPELTSEARNYVAAKITELVI